MNYAAWMIRISPAAPVLAALAVLGLAAAPQAAQAQDVYVTSSQTISTGINGNAYIGEDSSGHFSDPSTLQPYSPTVDITYSISGGLDVYNGSVVTDSAAGIIGRSVNANDTSTVNLSNLVIEAPVNANGSSVVTFSGGGYVEGTLSANANSIVTFLDQGTGEIVDGLNVSGNSVVTLAGADVHNNVSVSGNGTLTLLSSGRLISNYSLSASDSGIVNLSGGSVGGGLYASGDSTVVVSGGTVSGGFYDELGFGEGDFTFEGTGLAATADGYDNGDSVYDLSGTLLGGQSLDGDKLYVGSDSGFGAVQFLDPNASPAPEPSQMALFGFLALGLGGLMWRAWAG